MRIALAMHVLRSLPVRPLLLTVTLGVLSAASATSAARTASAQRPPVAPMLPRLIDDIRYLASDSLGGRLTGSPGADSAAAYLARRFDEVGLIAGSGGWFQNFAVASDAPAAQRAGAAGMIGRNVIGLLPGRDPELRNEVVVVGAHYDHLGHGEFGSLDPENAGRVHNGADDNASGTAALIRIAARLAADPPARSVLFIAFSGEELGLLGSGWYVKHAPYPMARTVAMINLDMVGRLRNNRLIVYGTETAKEFPKLVDSLNWYAGFDLKKQGDGYGPSDQSSFYAARRPVLYLFTDLHEDYHRASDDWRKINVDGLLRVTDFAANLTETIANRAAPLTFVDVPAAAGPAASGSNPPAQTPGYGAYLGTVPDMAGGAEGVRLTGVRAGSPAEHAGLRADDIITRIGDMDVPNLQAMTDALRSHKPGDTVEIRILRAGQVTTLNATLGNRGG